MSPCGSSENYFCPPAKTPVITNCTGTRRIHVVVATISFMVCQQLYRSSWVFNMDSSGSKEGGRGGHAPSPGPVKITHKKDGHQRRLHRFHVSAPPPPIRPLDPLLIGSCSCPDYQQCMFTSASQNVAFVHQ